MDVEAKLKSLPQSPGVYIMKGRDGAVLYIGKAKNLRSRVSSYFRPSGDSRYAVRYLCSRTEDIDCIVTSTEKEALLLEDTLLKKHKPKYNIRLKDSKTYVSIKITVADRFPRITATRQIRKDGSRYFGPYVSSADVRETIKFIRRIFPLCTCSPAVFNNRSRPCLDYQLGICSAPAMGRISEEAYRELVNGAMMFLEGKNRELLRLLKQKMDSAAQGLRYEEAARLRDRSSAIGQMLEEQKVVSHRRGDRDVDVFALARDGGTLVVQTLLVREGRLCGGADYTFDDDAGLPGAEVVSSFITQFYRGERYVPDEVIIPVRLDDAGVIAEWLTAKKGRRAALISPERGDKWKLLRMAEANAAEGLRRKLVEKKAKGAGGDVVAALKVRLKLRRRPDVIEAFDISNIGGELAVGAMAVFRGGIPDKGSYRLYRIKGVSGADDYAMIYETLSRRYKEKGGEAGIPDLILIDGGKGQLSMACKALVDMGITGLECAALAKDRPGAHDRRPARFRPVSKGERVFRPNVKDPILLREGTAEDLLLRRIRDEVHRFAIGYHRRLRSKAVSSVIDSVAGIGAKRKKALFERFGDAAGIIAASEEELVKVAGVTPEMARAVKSLSPGAEKGRDAREADASQDGKKAGNLR